MVVPALSGIHHLEVHVIDPRRSARWYRRVLGHEPALDSVERDEVVGYGMSHAAGGTR
jgi:catechol 2,3-dioxygenase-like lactoylglutathione lyase family enzyme